jgi:hypothetical protein
VTFIRIQKKGSSSCPSRGEEQGAGQQPLETIILTLQVRRLEFKETVNLAMVKQLIFWTS